MSLIARFLLRLLGAAAVLVLVLVLAFAAQSALVPELPAAADAPLVTARRTFSAEEVALVRRSLGLHLPLLWNDTPTLERHEPGAEPGATDAWLAHATETRFARWCGAALHGDFGYSLEYRRPVSEVLTQHLPRTLQLGLCAWIVLLCISVPLGVMASRLRSARGRGLFAFIAALSASTPEIVLGTLLLALLPGLWTFGAAVLVLSLGSALLLATHLRAALEDLQHTPWALALRGRGISGSGLLLRHLLRPALSPLVTLLGAALPLLVSGSVVVEHLFGITGMGEVSWLAATQGDLPLSMACVALGATLSLTGWLLADLVAAWLDPRRASYGVRA